MSKRAIKNKIEDLANVTHRMIFGGDAGKRTVTFAKNVVISFFGGSIAFVILFCASVIVARVLGPAEYGKYAVVFSIAQILSLLFVLELDVSALYFLTKKHIQRKSITASINVMFLINIVVFTFLSVGIYQFMGLYDISQFAFIGAIVLALTFAFKRMIDAFLRVKNQFKKQAIFKISEAVTVVSILIVLFYIVERMEYSSYILSIVLGGIVFIVLGGILVRDELLVRGATTVCMNKVFCYNIFGIVGATINGIIKNIDKIIAVAFLGASVGGIYTVYFTASVIVGARVTQLFINVFFPAVRANYDHIRSVFGKINTLFKRTFLLTIIISSGGVLIIVWLYGSQYPIVWYWILLSGLYMAVHFFASLYGWLLSGISRIGYKQHNISFLYGLIAYSLFFSVVFVNDLFCITTLLIALVVYRAVGGVVSFRALQKQLR